MKLKYLNNNKTSVFTDDQKVAIDGILSFLKEPFKDGSFIVSLCGQGGVGKTFCVDYIIQNSFYTPSVIMCCAPTHKACRNLSNSIGGKKVITIQSLFGFRLDCNIDDFDPNNPYFAPINNPKLTNLHKVLIIDESSMLNQKLVNYIVNYCRKLKIKVIFVGDDFQLAAPKDSHISSFSKSTFSLVLSLNSLLLFIIFGSSFIASLAILLGSSSTSIVSCSLSPSRAYIGIVINTCINNAIIAINIILMFLSMSFFILFPPIYSIFQRHVLPIFLHHGFGKSIM